MGGRDRNGGKGRERSERPWDQKPLSAKILLSMSPSGKGPTENGNEPAKQRLQVADEDAASHVTHGAKGAETVRA